MIMVLEMIITQVIKKVRIGMRRKKDDKQGMD